MQPRLKDRARRVTLDGGCGLPFSHPLSEFIQVPSQQTMSRFFWREGGAATALLWRLAELILESWLGFALGLPVIVGYLGIL